LADRGVLGNVPVYSPRGETKGRCIGDLQNIPGSVASVNVTAQKDLVLQRRSLHGQTEDVFDEHGLAGNVVLCDWSVRVETNATPQFVEEVQQKR
jgi:hypothetical protein